MFATFYFEITAKKSESGIFEKNLNWNMCETPGEMYMHDMVDSYNIFQDHSGYFKRRFRGLKHNYVCKISSFVILLLRNVSLFLCI